VAVPVLRSAALASLFCSTLLIAGCGGGGSAAAPAPAAAPAAPQALSPQLNRSQLKAVAASIYDDVLRAGRVAAAAKTTYQGAGQLFAIGTQTFQCSTSAPGTLALVITDQATAAQFDAGDTLSIQYQNCDLSSIGQNSTLDGTQLLTLESATGVPVDTSAWTARMTIAWTALASTANASLTGSKLDGSVRFDMSGTPAGLSVVSADMAALTQTDYLATKIANLPVNTALSSLAFQNFTLLHRSDLNGSSSSVQGKTVYRALGTPGSAPVTTTYTTNLPFLTTPAGVPVQGDLVAVASALRSVTLNGQVLPNLSLPASTTFRWVVLDATTLRLDTDENSDGVNESSFTFTFTEITQ